MERQGGDGDGNGGGGGDGDGNGGGGGDGDGNGDSPTEVVAAVPPQGWWTVLRKLAQEEGFFDEAADEVGTEVEFTFQNTWDDVPTWVSGNADIAQFGALEATRIGPRQDIEITVFGKNTPLNFGPMVQTGGPYDPDETGGVQESIDAIVEDGANFAIGSWGGADATSYDIAFASAFDYRFQEEGGDFSVVTNDYFTIGQLVAEGQVPVGSSGEGMGAAPQMQAGDIKPLFWLKDLIPEMVLEQDVEWGFPTMQNLCTRTEFYEENEDAIETYFLAQEMALQELRANPVEIITQSDEWVEAMGAGSEEEAEFIVNYAINQEGTDTLEPPEYVSVYESTEMSDEYRDIQSNFFDDVAEAGLTESDWADYVDYVQF